jgi:peptidoglycan/LPS O-acetylase OafA/YrhL
MKSLALIILAAAAVLVVILGGNQILDQLRAGRTLALVGWLIGLAGLALIIGRRRGQTARRLTAGLTLAALGLALMAIPTDSRGLLLGIRVGYAGCLLVSLPHAWRLYRESRRRSGITESTPKGASF